jgi:ADP-dependent NAD(P)H-hydrate dehydratase
MSAAWEGGEVDDALLRAWPLPAPDADGDKESRGRVLVVAGSREMPGAAVLAATAALRAGAGKLVIATPASVAHAVALAMPEARVIALPEGSDGSPTIAGLPAMQALASATACLLVGPGMIGEVGTPLFVEALLPLFRASTVLLDALAMDVVRSVRRFSQPVLLTPHAGEMAHLTGRDKEDLQAQPRDIALREAATWNAVLALKGPTTCIATADGRAWLHGAEVPGLGTSGSGDVLSGIIAGLAARGAVPEQAAVWGVALHARAGEALARRIGRVGYLARELAEQVPALMTALAPADLAAGETARSRAARVA